MAKVSDVIRIAKGEIGVCESPKNSNRQKYGRDYGWNGVFWCAQFVWWLGWKADGKNTRTIAKSASAADIQDLTVSKYGGLWIMKKNRSSATRKAYLKKAKPGDIVSFDFGAMDAVRDHVGIVSEVRGEQIICIEGNTSKSGSQSNGGMVCEQARPYKWICSAVRPKYTDGPAPTPGELDVDGECGPLTIKAFQKWLGLSQTGKLDVNTIKAFQKRMNIPVNGNWDKHTRQALQRYLNLRDNAGLDTDGDIGYLTVCALQIFLNKQK